MYEVVSQTPKEVFLIYIAFLGAALITYPLIRFIIKAGGRGLDRWR